MVLSATSPADQTHEDFSKEERERNQISLLRNLLSDLDGCCSLAYSFAPSVTRRLNKQRAEWGLPLQGSGLLPTHEISSFIPLPEDWIPDDKGLPLVARRLNQSIRNLVQTEVTFETQLTPQETRVEAKTDKTGRFIGFEIFVGYRNEEKHG